MSLVDLSLKKAYSSDVDNILYDFYIPVLERATEYDRIAGFFSSSSLAIAARGIVGLIKNNGKMKLIASPKLSKQDIEAIKDGYNDPQKYIEEKMLKELERLEDEFIRDHVFALAWMIANQKLEIKIAIVYDEDKNLLSYEDIQRSGIFHQKVGIIKDEQGNIVSFSGSINESAIGWLGNIEEFKVFRSWDKVERGYLDEDISKFERYWENKSERVKTIYIPYAIKRKLVEIAPKNIEEIQIEKRVYKANKKKIELFEHQEKAIASWIANKMRGIFEMATGTGKTFAALGCLQKLIEKEKGLVTVISCPYGHLVKQWVKEIENFGVPASIVIADSSNPKWKGDLYTNLINTKIGVTDRTIIVTTHNTFSLEEFNSILRETYKDNNLFLIVDEVHGVGAPKRRNGLKDFYRYRLGLSATPKRWFDWEGTDEIFNYFGGVVFRFSLDDAIHTINPLTKKTYLTPYVYKPFFVELTDNEIEEYRRETYKIVRNYQNKSEKEKRKIFDLLCIKRQEIIKNARNKYVAFKEILDEIGDLKHCLIYCSPQQIEKVQMILNDRNIIQHKFTNREGIRPSQKYNGLSEREYLIKLFGEGKYDALVAINCLDEGVNIPPAKIVIILASSGNPRQYIQRRGRVLRHYPGKEKAVIYDIIVIPSFSRSSFDNTLYEMEKKIFKKELIRYKEFSYSAQNMMECLNKIEKIEKNIKLDEGGA